MSRPYIPIHTSLLKRDINAYSDDGASRKDAFHKHGKAFLRCLASALGLASSAYSLRSNLGGIAVSGEVTLHSDDIYVQLSESCVGGGGVSMLYRTCDSRQDCCGHQNHFVSMAQLFSVDRQNEVFDEMRTMLVRIREKKGVTA